MTAARFKYLKLHFDKIKTNEFVEFQQLIRWEIRSAAAKRAVATKRRIYTKWPTRLADHKYKEGAKL